MKVVYDRRKSATLSVPAKVEIEVYFSRTERMWIQTSIQLLPHEWDAAKGIVVKRRDSRRLNATIGNQVRHIDDILTNLLRSGQSATKRNLKAVLAKQGPAENNDSFWDYCKLAVTRRNITASTMRTHQRAISALKRSKLMQRFADVTLENVRAFDDFLRDEDPARVQATIYGYHKCIKAYCNMALEDGKLAESPYARFRTRRGRSKVKQPLTLPELKALRNLNLTDRYQQMVRDQFVFMCYTGLSYVDLQAFRFEQHAVKVGDMWYIDGQRIKTGSQFFTPILKPAMDILERYNYTFKSITNQAMNRILGGLRVAAQIYKPITCHIARHTFATTVALENGCSIESLSKMLGHHEIKITQIYAKVMAESVVAASQKLARLE